MDTYSTYIKKKSGYNDVSKTVKILEKIAVGKLHVFERKLISLSLYNDNIHSILSRIDQLDNKFQQEIKTTFKNEQFLLIIFSGDKGLVGDLWHRLFGKYSKRQNCSIMIIGKKAKEEWSESGDKILHYSFVDKIPNNADLDKLARLLTSFVSSGKYNSISTLHMHPSSLLEQVPTFTQLLPLKLPKNNVDALLGYPIVDGSIKSIKKSLYKKYLVSSLQKIILETAVSEYSARTVAMEHASVKTDEDSHKLTMLYSRDSRQRETQKQLERFSSSHVII